MALFFRKRPDQTTPPAGRTPPVPPQEVTDSTQTMFVTGDARRDHDRIRKLIESLRELTSDVDLDELMVTMVDRAVKLVEAERGLLFTVDDENRPVLRVARAADGRDLIRNASFSTKVVSTVFERNKAVCQNDDQGGSFDPSQSMIDLNLRAVMCVPLRARDERLGALYVDTRVSQKRFTRGELRYFEAFADMLAIV
jgi:GAF domain-containing protein